MISYTIWASNDYKGGSLMKEKCLRKRGTLIEDIYHKDQEEGKLLLIKATSVERVFPIAS